MNDGFTFIKVTLHPRVRDMHVGCCFEFHVANQAARTMSPACHPFTARHVVSNACNDRNILSRNDTVGDVVFVDAAVGVVMRYRFPVYPEPALRPHSADFQPDAFVFPCRGNSCIAVVPGRSHVDMTQRIRCAIIHIPRLADSWLSYTLRLPAAGDLDCPCFRPDRSGVHPALISPDSIWVLGECPLAAQGNHFLQWRTYSRIDHCRFGLGRRTQQCR